jgi:hypothetical protein
LGVGRSGTSLAARSLNVLGVDLGREETMLPPGEGNPRGFWEQREVVELNDEILEALGGTWWYPPPRPPGWETADDMAVFRARIADLVKRHFAGSARWGFKDPRTTLTLPVWRLIAGEFDYVICLRNPLEVMSSADGALPREVDEVGLWLHYGCEALRLTAGRRRTFVFYEEWMDDPLGVSRRLGCFVHGLNGAEDDHMMERAAAEWDPDLRHERADDLELARRDDVAVEARALHFLIRALADAERNDDEHARALNAVASALDGASEARLRQAGHSRARE